MQGKNQEIMGVSGFEWREKKKQYNQDLWYRSWVRKTI